MFAFYSLIFQEEIQIISSTKWMLINRHVMYFNYISMVHCGMKLEVFVYRFLFVLIMIYSNEKD